MAHGNKSPLKIWEKRECGRIQGLPNFFEYPHLSQEHKKLRTSNLARVFTGSSEQSPLKIGEKRERERIQVLPKFLEYPLVKLELQIWHVYSQGACEEKPLKIGEKREHGHAHFYSASA